MNLVRFLSWSLILVSVLLSSPNVPAQAVWSVREILGAIARRFAVGAESPVSCPTDS